MSGVCPLALLNHTRSNLFRFVFPHFRRRKQREAGDMRLFAEMRSRRHWVLRKGGVTLVLVASSILFFYRWVNVHPPTPPPLQLFQGAPVQQSTPSSMRYAASTDAASDTSQASTGSHASQVHEWVPRQASGTDNSQQTVTNRDAKAVKPSMESSEAVPLSGPDSLEGAQELWAAMGPTTAFWLDPLEQLDSSSDVLWKNSPARTGEEILSDENEIEVAERKRWQEWAKHAAEHERQRRMKVRVMRLASKRAQRFATRSGPIWKTGYFLAENC